MKGRLIRRDEEAILRKHEVGGETTRGGAWNTGSVGEGLMPGMQTG